MSAHKIKTLVDRFAPTDGDHPLELIHYGSDQGSRRLWTPAGSRYFLLGRRDFLYYLILARSVSVAPSNEMPSGDRYILGEAPRT